MIREQPQLANGWLVVDTDILVVSNSFYLGLLLEPHNSTKLSSSLV